MLRGFRTGRLPLLGDGRAHLLGEVVAHGQDEAVAEGVISAEERALLEELREITLETITVDDFDSHELRAASYYDPPLPGKREAA